jgi:murein DD-endopeptidase MepM/ murein hydrolase activator NlpD
MRFRLSAAAVGALALAAALATPAQAGSANVAALQVAMRAVHLYGGSIDGVAGPGTRGAVRRFQRRRGLAADGIAGAATRRALGRRGGPAVGSRAMRQGNRGWDVAGLQFMLRRRGTAAGSVDGGFGASTRRAVAKFQLRAGLHADGVAGPATLSALKGHRTRRPRRSGVGVLGGPVLFFRPVRGPIGDGFGSRWGRSHQGIDFPVPAGTRVGAAGRGVTRFAGWNSGGYGYLVIISHRLGFETWYAHLSRITTWPGERVTGGTRIGYVGSTGHSTGPHLHFEVRHNGTPIDPMPRLLGATASSARRGRGHPGCDRRGLRRRGMHRSGRATVC